MTDGFLPVDAALWLLAVVLLALAVWLLRRDAGSPWDPAVFFGGALGAAFGRGALPLREGPVPPEGWEGDSDDLEAVYSPGERIAPGLAWSDVSTWSDALAAAVARRCEGVRLIWVEPPTVQVSGFEPTVVAPTPEAIGSALGGPSERVVLAAGAHAMELLEALRSDAGLRDRVRAVLLVAPSLDLPWLAAHFNHAELDVEVTREVPFLTLRVGVDAARQRLPDPPAPANGIRCIAPVDLGVLPEDVLGDERVARALAVTVAALG